MGVGSSLAKFSFLFVLLIGGIFNYFSAVNYVVFAEPSINVSAPPIMQKLWQNSFNIWLYLDIFSVDQVQKHVTAKITLWLVDFPQNATEVDVILNGGSNIEIKCRRVGDRLYKGESQLTSWSFYGIGEMYPFDSYKLRLKIVDSFLFHSENRTYIYENAMFNISQSRSFARFIGPNTESLEGVWGLDENRELPIQYIDKECIVTLERRPLVPVAVSLLPIILCYFLLGCSLIIPRKKLNSRLEVYLSLFVFAPMFLLMIQIFLPCRSSFSIPEVLLVNLMISTGIFAIASILSRRAYTNETEKHKLLPEDIAALTISLSILLFFYLTSALGVASLSLGAVRMVVFLAYFFKPIVVFGPRLKRAWKKPLFKV